MQTALLLCWKRVEAGRIVECFGLVTTEEGNKQGVNSRQIITVSRTYTPPIFPATRQNTRVTPSSSHHHIQCRLGHIGVGVPRGFVFPVELSLFIREEGEDETSGKAASCSRSVPRLMPQDRTGSEPCADGGRIAGGRADKICMTKAFYYYDSLVQRKAFATATGAMVSFAAFSDRDCFRFWVLLVRWHASFSR